MDLSQYIQKLTNLSSQIEREGIEYAVVPNANELLANTKNRIILDGKATSGGDIGSYDKKPNYFSKSEFVNKSGFKGVGKNGFKGERIKRKSNGDYKVVKSKPKSMYIPDGYFGFRSANGRENSKVNVTLSGDTNNRYQLVVNGNSVIMGMTTQKAAKIRQGNESRFKQKIYASTKQEIEAYNENVAKDLVVFTKQVLT